MWAENRYPLFLIPRQPRSIALPVRWAAASWRRSRPASAISTSPRRPSPTLAPRRKIAEAGVSFEVPGPDAWPERLDAVLSTLEIAYSKAHEDAAGAGAHAGYAAEMLDLTRVLAGLLPNEPEALALAALVRFAEA